MQLEDWLDDLCVRFIINLPPEELASVERICFQVEEAQWFYEDFIRPLDPSLPSLSLKQFSLRIFQHCPLFSQWSAQHHTTAFAEFLAYKQRVPVRGAIMLNEAMDEVVLVKGWKKGANWSFPRGKINKDENDLDCAVREVYEETGFDIEAAGLVKSEREMKYIEVTMREQHMRLYVFRGVPKSTHFEPRTRKEISKIEWYKLTDLPILKKKSHHDTQDDHAGLNANKFYMVAPFLHPLKKWIAQQRKREPRHVSNLAVPPVLAEESITDSEIMPVPQQPYTIAQPGTLSSLPEVMTHHTPQHIQDPSAHLKELLQIGGHRAIANPTSQSVAGPGADAAKSSALLALLRNGSTTDAQPASEVPEARSQVSVETPMPFLPGHQHHYHQAISQYQAEPSAPPLLPQPIQQEKQNLLSLFSKRDSSAPQTSAPQEMRAHATAPYQRTGDPDFARNSPEETRHSIVPSANSLPKLTHHTKALLDAFKISPSPHAQHPPQPAAATRLPPTKQNLLDAFKQSTPQSAIVPTALPSRPPTVEVSSGSQIGFQEVTTPIRELSSHSPAISRSQPVSLADLFKRPAVSPPVVAVQQSHPQQDQVKQNAPVELAAAPVEMRSQTAPSQNELLAALFRKDKTEPPKRQRSPVAKAGQTGATITGPINQPQFEGIAKTNSEKELPARRSPVPPHRTLFDPKQPPPVKILARPESQPRPSPRSPRAQKAQAPGPSPKKAVKQQEKPFQPQILRRPQASESRQSLSPSPSSLAPVDSGRPSRRPSNLASQSPSPRFDQLPVVSPPTVISRQASGQSDSHKQSLLSLFGTGPSSIPAVASPVTDATPRPISTAQTAILSPTTQSFVVSPLTDDPISTRSRVGSLASTTSIGLASHGPGPAVASVPESKPKPEKRQTAAGDKAFLLGYLGRIASQDA